MEHLYPEATMTSAIDKSMIRWVHKLVCYRPINDDDGGDDDDDGTC